jgi:Predicted pyridoxal phosphate-dependent enzyme apparently involved in regulation of cell wall biogenesis
MTDGMREVSPTAGLPLSWRDLMPSGASLEHNLAAFLCQPDTQIECSGTAALIVALVTLQHTSNRRSVVIPAYTCPLVALAVAHCGLKPMLCDTRRNHFDLCPESLAAVCNEDTLAVIPTHLGGRVADLLPRRPLQKCGACVVEDAAQSLGARWQGSPSAALATWGFTVWG